MSRKTLLKSFRNVAFLLLAASLSLQRQASAEAYTAQTARRSRLWNAPESLVNSCATKPMSSSGLTFQHKSHYTRRQIRLRSGGSETVTHKNFWSKQLFHELFAEFIGMGIIVGMGVGADMSAMFTGSLVGLLHIAAVWSIAVVLAVSATGPISGAHLNPAISLAFAWLRPSPSFGWSKVIPYVLAQLAGAIVFSCTSLALYASKIREFELASSIVRGTTESITSAKAFGLYYADSVTTPVAFFAEVFGTAFLGFVVFALTNPKNDTVKNKVFVPPLVGITVFGLISVVAPLTQAGFNPARDFGPRIVAWLAGWGKISFQSWWLYTVAPLIGAPMGAWLADKVLYGGDEGIEKES